MKFLSVIGLLALAGNELWKRRDKDQVTALLSVARKRPTMYLCKVNTQVPVVEIHGSYAHVIGSTISMDRNGIGIFP